MKKIAIYFPGIGYHCDKPLLYYSRKVAFEHGYEEFLNLSYGYHGANLLGNEEKILEAFHALYEQAKQYLADISWDSYDEILFVSKSIGTAVAAAYAKRNRIFCKNIFFTPLELTFNFKPCNGIAFTGTKDPWVEKGLVERECKSYHLPLTVVDGANHSLEGDHVWKNLQILKDVMKITDEFLRE